MCAKENKVQLAFKKSRETERKDVLHEVCKGHRYFFPINPVFSLISTSKNMTLANSPLKLFFFSHLSLFLLSLSLLFLLKLSF